MVGVPDTSGAFPFTLVLLVLVVSSCDEEGLLDAGTLMVMDDDPETGMLVDMVKQVVGIGCVGFFEVRVFA